MANRTLASTGQDFHRFTPPPALSPREDLESASLSECKIYNFGRKPKLVYRVKTQGMQRILTHPEEVRSIMRHDPGATLEVLLIDPEEPIRR